MEANNMTNQIDYRPMIQVGEEFKAAVAFWKTRNECVRELEKARKALYRSGVSAAFSAQVTDELRRVLFELEAMKQDGRWKEVA
jgi:hypothetical protein